MKKWTTNSIFLDLCLKQYKNHGAKITKDVVRRVTGFI